MLFLAAASLASAAVPNDQGRARSPAVSARATAQVTVRLIQGEVVKLRPNGGYADPRLRVTILRLADGNHEARIVEFE